MNEILEYLNETWARHPEMKYLIKSPGFWRNCVMDHLSWKYRSRSLAYRAIYAFLETKIGEEFIVSVLLATGKTRYVDSDQTTWRYCDKDTAFRFPTKEFADQFVKSLTEGYQWYTTIEAVDL